MSKLLAITKKVQKIKDGGESSKARKLKITGFPNACVNLAHSSNQKQVILEKQPTYFAITRCKVAMVWLVALLLMITPSAALADGTKTFEISGAKVTIEQITEEQWLDRADYFSSYMGNWSIEKDRLVVWDFNPAWSFTAFEGLDCTNWFSCMVQYLWVEYVDKSTQYFFTLYREDTTHIDKSIHPSSPLKITVSIPTSWLKKDKINACGSVFRDDFFSPAQYLDLEKVSWASSAVNELARRGILVPTDSSQINFYAKQESMMHWSTGYWKYLPDKQYWTWVWEHDLPIFRFFPEKPATRTDAAVWLMMAFPTEFDKTKVAGQWQKDPLTAEQFRSDLGYSVFSRKQEVLIASFAGNLINLTLFAPLDAALRKGVLDLQADGKLHLSGTDILNRADFCRMACAATGLAEDATASHAFWDLKDPEWTNYLGAIGACINKGILSGYADGSFWPEGPMTRAEVAGSIYHMMGLGNTPKNPQEITPFHSKEILGFKVGEASMTQNGKISEMDVLPMIHEGRTLLPIRYLAEPMGANVEWDPTQNKVTISLNKTNTVTNLLSPTTVPTFTPSTETASIGIGFPSPYEGSAAQMETTTMIELWIGERNARVNGQTVPIDADNPNVTPLLIPPGRTMLPLRFIAETLGAHVQWESDSGEIIVIYSSQKMASLPTTP